MAGTKTVNTANKPDPQTRSNSTRVAHKNPLRVLLLTFLLAMGSTPLFAQEDSYEFKFAPDLWYNDVDGIRVGVRVLGEEAFQEGPHQIDAGLWLSTWFPDLPVSYYFSITEPFRNTSNYANKGSAQLISSIRTGFSMHRFQFNKRWQPGFDEYDYKELSIYFSFEKMYDYEYRIFPGLWQKEYKGILGLKYRYSINQESGRFIGLIDFMAIEADASVGTIELIQRFDLSDSFKLRLRGFAGLGTEKLSRQYQFMAGLSPAYSTLQKGLTRAKGTIPQPWMESGFIHTSGGANLRGYIASDLNNIKNSDLPLYLSFYALNTELEFPNPLNSAIKRLKYIGNLTELRSYLFIDAGKGFGFDADEGTVYEGDIISDPGFISDAGLGLQISFNIPDYLGKDRGIFIRYDIPFWLSNPEQNDPNFKYRNLIGVGAIFSF